MPRPQSLHPLFVWALLLAATPAPAAGRAGEGVDEAGETPSGEATPPRGEDAAAGPRAEMVLLGGETLSGPIRAIEDGRVRVGDAEAVPFFEIQEIRFPRDAPARSPQFDAGPLLRFRDGADLAARVLSVEGERAVVRSEHLGEVRVPVDGLRAFRLRETHPRDPLFQEDLEGPAPERDTVYVRRRNLLRVKGVFRGLDEEWLYFERGGTVQRVRRRLVHGVALAPTASATPEADPPQTLEYGEAGRLPAYLLGLEGDTGPGGSPRRIRVRFGGDPESAAQSLPIEGLRGVAFASDRVAFLSDLEPRRVEEAPVVGRTLSWRADRAVGGGPLRLGGRVYRRGLGVRSRCVLEYDLGGAYRVFAAVVGLDDAAGRRGGVTFRVRADGKEIFEQAVAAGDPPVPVSLPVEDVRVLALEVDYGEDGVDTGDHADWAQARLTR